MPGSKRCGGPLDRARPLYAVAAAAARLPAATSVPTSFTGGASPTVVQYDAVIDLLADDTRIDLVLACIEPQRSNDETRQIHGSLLAHARTALKQQLIATFLRMERAGWLVPSTDGAHPARLPDPGALWPPQQTDASRNGRLSSPSRSGLQLIWARPEPHLDGHAGMLS